MKEKMLAILTYAIKYSVIFFCNSYVFAKITATKLKLWDILFVPVIFAASLGLYYVTVYAKLLVPLAILLLCVPLYLVRFKQPFDDTVALSMVAFGITIFAMVIAALLAAVVFPALEYFYKDELIIQIGNLMQAITHFVLVIIAFHTKRLKNSLTPATNDEVYEKLLLASVVSIFSMTLFYTVENTDSTLKVIAAIAIFCGLVLIVQWRRTVDSGFNKNMERRTVKRLELVLNQYERVRGELLKKNAELAGIIHRDNKFLPAMRVAVGALSQKYSNDKSLKKLSDTLESVYSERLRVVASYGLPASESNKTGVLSIDSVMDYFRMRAEKGGVKFVYEFDAFASQQILDIFGEHASLNELLCDLVENALIAVRGADGGKVALKVELENSFPCIKVFDNGEDFAERVLRNMGRRRITTHENEGGSGIGLLTLFNTLRSRRASFFLDEAPQNGFKKCVCIIFDGKDEYFIKSSRPCVKKICLERENFTLIEPDPALV